MSRNERLALLLVGTASFFFSALGIWMWVALIRFLANC